MCIKQMVETSFNNRLAEHALINVQSKNTMLFLSVGSSLTRTYEKNVQRKSLFFGLTHHDYF